MKKIRTDWACTHYSLIKFFRIMRLSLFLMLFLVAQTWAIESYSQKTVLNLNMSNVTVIDVLEEIENQTDFYFLFNYEQLNSNKKIDVKLSNSKIDETLNQVLKGTGLDYTIRDRQVIIKKEKQLRSDFSSVQQQKTVKGKVIDEDGLALPGVAIVVKGSTIGTVTDLDGNYSISSVTNNTTLVFSFVGMLTQDVLVEDLTTIDVSMKASTIGLDEVVAIGYGTQKKSSITGAISTVKADKIEAIPVSNLSNALAGRLSGVFVDQSSGAPGYAAIIRIRAANTWKSSGATPLFVIDGIVSDKFAFDGLDNNEVEEITVLKDAASAAIYGSRAANGVILVTTKTGKSGKFQLKYNYFYSFDQPSKIPEYMGAADMVKYTNHATSVSGMDPWYDEKEAAYFQNNDHLSEWYDLAYSDPVLQKHSLNASGGTEKVRYFIGGSYYDQTGFIKTSGFEKYNIRSNIDVNFTEELSGFFKFSYNEGTTSRFSFQEDMSSAFSASPSFGSLWGRLLYQFSEAKPMTADGKLINPGWIGSPLAFIEEGGENSNTDQNTNFLIGLTYKVPTVEGLSFSGLYNRSIYNNIAKNFEVKPTLYNVVREGSHGHIYTDEIIGPVKAGYPSKERLAKYIYTGKNYQLNLSANYARSFGDHNIEGLFVYEQSEFSGESFYGVRENFPLIRKDQFWATSSDREDSYVGGGDFESARSSYIGRLAYNFADKYFLQATVRRDGSMQFAPDYRWGNFPSVSAGWVLSEEDFVDLSFLNFLKVRGSWGLVGNDAVGGWQWKESFGVRGSTLMGSSIQNRVRYNGIVNEELTWEKTREWNIGIDSRIFKGVIVNAEYYNKHTYDILDARNASLPVSFGGSMPDENYGIVDAHGFELELGYTGKVRDINYGISGNFTYATNEIKLKDVAENARDYNQPNGRSTDYVAMLVHTDIIRTQEELDALPEGYTIFGKTPALGVLNFEDVSGAEDGVPDGKIDNFDRQVLDGKHWGAPYSFGLNLTADWKGFAIDVFLQGKTGVSKMFNDAYGRRYMVAARPATFWKDSWSPDNTTAEYPQAVWWGFSNDHLPSTFWLKKGDYLRLQHLNLSYSLPKSITEKMRLSKMRFYATGTNLFTISSFDYHDPTVPEMRSYPTMKTYTMGVEVTF